MIPFEELGIKHIVHFFLQGYLNPVALMFYLFVATEVKQLGNLSLFVSTGTNSQKLLLTPYLVIMPILYMTWLIINYYFLQSFNEQLLFVDTFAKGYHWLHYVCFIPTAVVLNVYLSKSGMEGNVMGFIFAPFLFLGIAVYSFLHFRWIWTELLTKVS